MTTLGMLAVWAIVIVSGSCTGSHMTGRLPGWSDKDHLPFFGAIALGLFTHPPDPREAEQDLSAIASLGASGVVLPILWTSSDVSSTRIEPFAYGTHLSAYDGAYLEIARRAHAHGLAVEIRPIVRLERLVTGEWRGTLRPTDWQQWWKSYTDFILHHADLAETAGAEIFCIGSELGTTEASFAQWSSLIAAVRKRFRGCLIYSANWDHYEAVTFWNLLDGIGLSAYYELATREDASLEELTSAWRAHRDRILEWARPIGKPLFLTEVGYPAQRGAPVHPWDYTMSAPADPVAQMRCFQAFASAWQDAGDLRGVTIWIWTHGRRGPRDNSYAIAGKPAEEVIRRFFMAPRPAPTPAP